MTAKNNKKRNRIVKKPFIGEIEKKETKKEIKKDFYKIVTENRSFLVNEISDVMSLLTEDEKSFSVLHIEYIGYFKGKEDVLCITENGKKKYMVYLNVNSMLTYDEFTSEKADRPIWKTNNWNNLNLYYEKFKENGVVLIYDVYMHQEMYKKEVNKQLK